MGMATIFNVIDLERIRAAAERARPHVHRTPMAPVEGALLKLECLQPTGSFKVRGFFAAALALPDEKRLHLFHDPVVGRGCVDHVNPWVVAYDGTLPVALA